jgi:hypothetical protein
MLTRILIRVLLVCGGTAFAFVAAGAAVEVGYWIMHGNRFPHEDYRTAMLKQIDAPGERPSSGRPGEDPRGVPTVIHPYLGFVPAPGKPDETTIGDARQIPPRSDSELVIGVFGGSFAAGVCAYGGSQLSRLLSVPGKEARVLCMAAGGYKQPQQLLALAYLLAQGAHLDLVLNIDGFNEIALPPLDKPQGVAPIYPRDWFWEVGNLEDPLALKLLGELSLIDTQRGTLAALFVRWEFYRSALLALTWESGDRLFNVERDRILTELREHKIEQRSSYAATGPTMTFADDDVYFSYLARIWRDASLQMKFLCDANGIAYEHFLQPNQFIEGSKPLTPNERSLVSNPAPYGRSVVLGYPRLRRAGEELAQQGVRFHDLTMAFRDVPDELYVDRCCHVNAQGYLKIVGAIGEFLRGDESARSQLN